MSKELNIAMNALRHFIQKADATFPCMPDVTVTFPTQQALDRFRAQVMADTDANTIYMWERRLPPGIEGEFQGLRLRLKVRT